VTIWPALGQTFPLCSMQDSTDHSRRGGLWVYDAMGWDFFIEAI
jgi:hypothetical protein